MQTEKEITEAIGKLILEIQEKYPEMSKYIGEMPVTNPDKEHPDISRQNLTRYYEELKAIMKKYAVDHEPSSADIKEKVEDEKL